MLLDLLISLGAILSGCLIVSAYVISNLDCTFAPPDDYELTLYSDGSNSD